MNVDWLASILTCFCGLTVLHFYTARVRFWRNWAPAFAHAIKTWRTSGSETAKCKEVLACMHEKHEAWLKETATVWSVMIESFWLPYFCAVNYYAWADVSQLPCFLSGFIVVPALHELSKPDVKLTAVLLQQFTLSTSLAILLSSIGFPRELLPILYVARIMLGTFSTDGQFCNKVNVSIAPLWVVSHWMQKESAAPADLFYYILCEVLTCAVTALAISTLNDKEYEIAAANLQLKAKVKEVEEAESSGGAAQRLLAVTCDAFARLTHDLRISGPSRSLSDLLMCGFGSSVNKGNLEGAPFSRYVDAGDLQRLNDFIAESSKSETPPRSIHLLMKDSSGITFNAELFHVSVPSLRSEQHEHLIGITQEHGERGGLGDLAHDTFDRSEQSMGSTPSDMRHILGYRVKSQNNKGRATDNASQSEGSGSGVQSSRSSRSSRTSSLVRLRMLEKVNFVIDVQSLHDDFLLRSVKLSFKETEKVPKSAMPNLLEWMKPQYRDVVFNWVQAHANAFYAGRECQESPLRGVKLFSPMASAKTILAGEMTAVDIMDSLDDNAGKGKPTQKASTEDHESSEEGEMYMDIELRQLFAH
mmetsp:Transcript_22414/g.42287  ORF Transcript_22414/g.42287 Transcript_22414/m.42287 type:complete len:588 (-) Transcript_22414:69-1832(-)